MSDLTPPGEIMAGVRARAVDALHEAVKVVGDQADRNAPKDTKRLINSRRTSVDAGALIGEIRYGDGLPDPRAVMNHEKSELHHKDGGPKYLERAIASERGRILDGIAVEIRKTLSGGG